MKSRLRTQTERVVIASIAMVTLAFGAVVPAAADAIDDAITVDQQLRSAATTFADVYSDPSASEYDAAAAAADFQRAAVSAQFDFEQIAARTEYAALAAQVDELADITGDMGGAGSDIADALNAQDAEALAEAESDLSTAMDAYDAASASYNDLLAALPVSPLDDPTFTAWLTVLIIAIAFLLLAVAFAVLTRKQEGLLPPKTDRKGNVSQLSLARLRMMVVVWAGLFVVGAAIPFLQVAFAQPDADGVITYRVFWYPLAVGAVLTVIGVVQYFRGAAKVRSEGSAAPYSPDTLTPAGTPTTEPAPGGTSSDPAASEQLRSTRPGELTNQ